ncbi:hypothetical protein HGRIS_012583 [Hohenbuehelia grisea]|uniref:Beta-lactamase-related domain-containing protein n=1 Tax=Hohenbuehelia grisea TaxID=104357 RepID=A0ABR3ISU2_9AGAR
MRAFDIFSAAAGLLSSQVVFRSPAAPSSSETQILTPELDDYINRVLSDWNSPAGAGVAVVRLKDDGKWQVETKGYGNARTDGTKVTKDTLFAIGSNSKLFTTLAVGQLISNESLSPRISWKTKIKQIIPEFTLMDPIASEGTSIIDAMSHRTGLPRHDMMYGLNDKPLDVIERTKYLRPSMEFREGNQYNNVMYNLLSYVPTALLPSHPTIDEYVKANILDPLQLNSTTYSYEVASRSGNLADGIGRQNMNRTKNPLDGGIPRGLPYWHTASIENGHVISGAGGVISNAVDMAKWLQVLLSNGRDPYTNVSVIPEEVISAVFKGVTIFNASPNFNVTSAAVYGGGLWQSSYQGHVIVEHTGGTPGYLTSIARLPFDNLGVAVLTNDLHYGAYYMQVIKHRIIDHALNLPRWDYNTILKDQINKQTPPLGTPRPSDPSLPERSVSSLAGVYENLGYGRIELCEVPKPTSAATKQSNTCRDLIKELPVRLPGVINPKIPTLVASWDRFWLHYIQLEHFDGNVFNLTTWKSFVGVHILLRTLA